MKTLLLYYTGTGNTLDVCFGLQRALGTCDIVSIIDAQKVSELNLSSYDYIGIGFPVHAFSCPFNLIKALKKLKDGKNRFFVFCDSGEGLKLNNQAMKRPIRIMKKKGYAFFGSYRFIMPYNIIFKYDDMLVKELLDAQEMKADIMAYYMRMKLIRTEKTKIYYPLLASVVRVEHLAGYIDSFFYRVDPHKCVLCQKCIKVCPSNNIYLKDGRIKFGHNCDICMACSMKCPQNAISIGFLNSWKLSGNYDFHLIRKEIAGTPDYVEQRTSSLFYRHILSYLTRTRKEYKNIQSAIIKGAFEGGINHEDHFI